MAIEMIVIPLVVGVLASLVATKIAEHATQREARVQVGDAFRFAGFLWTVLPVECPDASASEPDRGRAFCPIWVTVRNRTRQSGFPQNFTATIVSQDRFQFPMDGPSGSAFEQNIMPRSQGKGVLLFEIRSDTIPARLELSWTGAYRDQTVVVDLSGRRQ